MCDGGWKWWAGESECDIISGVIYARLTEWDRKLIPEIRWCIAKWTIGDFYRRYRWSREGNERWGVTTTRGWTEIRLCRLSSGESFRAHVNFLNIGSSHHIHLMLLLVKVSLESISMLSPLLFRIAICRRAAATICPAPLLPVGAEVPCAAEQTAT